MLTHTVSASWTSRGAPVSARVSASGNAEQNGDFDVTAGVQFVATSFSFTVATLQMVFILSSADCTIKTNNATTPGNTITLKANKPLWWYKDCGMPNPFTVNVTALYIDSATAARVQFEAIGN